MFAPTSLLATLLLAISVAASPLVSRTKHVSLPVARRINTSNGTANLVQHDKALIAALERRAAAIQGGLEDRSFVVEPTNVVTQHAVSYIVSVGIGSPPTTYDLFLQTSSSNIWIGNGKQYIPTSTSKDTGQPMVVTYTNGQAVFGEEWLDTFTVTPDLVASYVSFGVAGELNGFSAGFDGYLGLAPAPLNVGTLLNQPEVILPTLADDLYNQGVISEEVVSLSFAPSTNSDGAYGEIMFGGTDPSKYTGGISYVPLNTTGTLSNFWAFDGSIAYGDEKILPQGAVAISAGSMGIFVPSDVYSAYQQATGATKDPSTQMLTLTPSQYSNLQNLNFMIGTETYALTPNGQIWPRALNSYIDGNGHSIYSILLNTGSPSGHSGLNVVLGHAFLERFYCVLDTTRHQVGFATTIYANASTN